MKTTMVLKQRILDGLAGSSIRGRLEFELMEILTSDIVIVKMILKEDDGTELAWWGPEYLGIGNSITVDGVKFTLEIELDGGNCDTSR